MKRGIIAVLVVGAIIIAGYLLATKSATAPSDLAANDAAGNNETAANTDEAAATDDLSGTGTFADFFARGESVTCTFSAEHNGVESEGEFWYSDERMRVESVTRAEGEVYTSNMIDDGEQTYVWSGTAAGMQAMVFPSEMSNSENFDSYEAGQADARVSMDQQVRYACESWTPQNTRFVPPSDIEFVDMDAMMQGMFEGEMRGMPEGMNF